MIGLDTNVLVRYLVTEEADAEQSQRAVAFVNSQAQNGETFFLNHVVVLETYWVLNRHYGIEHAAILEVFEKLALHSLFCIDEPDLFVEAVRLSRSKKADFPDCLIDVINRATGCKATASFDAKALKKLGFIAA